MASRHFVIMLLLPMILCTIGCSHDASSTQLGEGSIRIEDNTRQYGMTVDHHLRNPLSPYVYVSWFPAPGTEELAEINSNGAGVKGWAQAGSEPRPMLFTHVSTDGLQQVGGILRKLPPSQQQVPQHAAVIVTFSNGSDLETRVYDRFSLPPSVHRLWHILSAPGMVMDCGPTTQS